MPTSNSKITIGSILIILGLLWLSKNLLIIPDELRTIIFSFPMILFVIGIIILIKSRNSLFGYVLVGIGGYKLLTDKLHIPLDFLEDFWPVILILLGIYILLKGKSVNSISNNAKHESKFNFAESSSESIDFIDDFNILSGSDKTVTSEFFKGGKITTIFGGTDINLRNSKLAEGIHTLEITTIFGGIDLYVPKDWNVIIKVTAMFGGFDDERIKYTNEQTDMSRTLIIKGVVIFGGGDIKN